MDARQQKAIDVMPDAISLVQSDAVKLTYNLKDLVAVAIVAKDEIMKQKLALAYVSMEEISKQLGAL